MRKYIKKNIIYYIGALICVLMSTLFAVILQFIKGSVLDYAIAGEVSLTIKYAVFLIGFIICEILFYFFYRLLSSKFVVQCTKELKKNVFESVLYKNYVEYKEAPQGEYISKYITEVDAIKSKYFGMLPFLWEILFKVFFVSLALFRLDWKIAVVTIFLLTTPLYIPKLIERQVQCAQKEYLQATEENLVKIKDWLSGFEIIKNYSLEKTIMNQFDATNTKMMDKLLKDRQLGACAQLITTLISYISYFIVLACAAWLVVVRRFSPGDFFVAIGMIDQLSYPLISLAEIIRQLLAIKPVCSAVEKFERVEKREEREAKFKTFKNEIVYSNVFFSYNHSDMILNNFNFTIKKGQHYLIKGPSGCGKTTMVNLLLRYYQADNGEIFIDNKSIDSLDNMYDYITVVRQEAILFHDTVRNNLTMYQNIPDEDIIEVLTKLGLVKFANVEALNLVITEDGTNLSGGEKKRLCLARALLRKNEILIFDEPLANLDDKTAKKIEDLLLEIENKTVLIVSHQFSSDKLHRFAQIYDFEK